MEMIRHMNYYRQQDKKTTTKKCTNNNMSTDSKLSKTQMSKIIQFGEFLGILLSKLAGPLMKAAIPLARNVLALLGIIAAASAIDVRITKKKKKKYMVLEQQLS